ncbi:MAG: bifunctional UDP-3-O-[3-hydroxymyristoyl] N-acetylglucosamine deacetylase/3-hydroxyacyl-ACP dehydratase [Verrucomicrobia bacterium]|nr:bifunctional UDP-3-O-[3-hydroxymyristoyl] N-acetylglucosamine deacetylase/3-hydroxyacyl-ACP dehydratase [Verrucomicrobiota bacterium]
MLHQQTLQKAVSFAGTGLHSGNRVSMTFLPAPPNTGLRFRRTDLDGKPEIEARVENVGDTNRSTTLAKGSVKIHTVEHVLATFSGCGIDNAIVELDANEPPIADGSSRQYCKMVREAGVVAQAEKREPYAVTAPVEFESGETTMSVFPHDRLKITCTSADKQGRFTQFFSLEVTPESWEKELSHARTFCFYEEIEFLFKNGLIKGGSLENAVVIRDDAILTAEPLRYREEFVRHKMLDILGDLALVGRPVTGHIVAVKPSHAANCELARRVLAQMSKPAQAVQTFSPPPPKDAMPEETPVRDGATLDVMQVMKILPHRPPFLMVDRVTKIAGNKITAQKNVTMGEPFFEGHFPGHPIMPGVLQLEAMAQVAGILMMRQAENAGKLAYFMSAEEVKWRKPVRPGDVLVIEVELTKSRGKIGKAKGTCLVDGDVVSEASVTFMLMDK